MLFNSYEFIFGYLPVTLAGFWILGRLERHLAIAWLILASLVFYAWWRPLNVLLIAPSILINYALSRVLQRNVETRPALAKAVLVAGILFNLAFLGYFKYRNFLAGTVNDVFGTNLVLVHLVLPLGISFITFQKIAFLIDVQAGRVKSFTLQDYALFVLFFPQLIAGPIVHYREMMPQFHAASAKPKADDIAVALSLFAFGLFKKVVLADGIAPLVTPIYERAAAGDHPALIESWIAALGFTLQIYFDFSGYTDMALGLARLFGIKLPVNFNSPLKATSIIEFWLRWHVSLTRFLTAYLYNPLVLTLTRKRLAAGKAVVGGRATTPSAFITLLALPTILTMFISGLWHGAGYQYLLWGLMHGLFLAINHAWRLTRPRVWPDAKSYVRAARPVGFVLTFLSVVFAMVMFRASTVGTAGTLWAGMAGANGVTLPRAVLNHIGPLGGWLEAHGVAGVWEGGAQMAAAVAWIAALLAISWLMPNTLQMLARFEPALGVKVKAGAPAPTRLSWHPSIGWALALSVVAVAGILSLGQLSEFLYWQF